MNSGRCVAYLKPFLNTIETLRRIHSRELDHFLRLIGSEIVMRKLTGDDVAEFHGDDRGLSDLKSKVILIQPTLENLTLRWLVP